MNAAVKSKSSRPSANALRSRRSRARAQTASMMSAAIRARRARWRRRNGLVPRRIDVDEHGLAEMLIASGRLTEAQALQSDLQERELSALVADLIARWRHDVTGH